MFSQIRDAREELRQAGEIVAGNPYLLRMKFLDLMYAPLDKLWSVADEYADLEKSGADATKLFKDHEDKIERLFWSQFNAPARSLPLSEKMAAIAELHRLSGLVMRSLIDHLWPKGPKLDSYFGFVQQLFGARARIDAEKRSACIEGAQMALARVKTYWAEMEATAIAAQDSNESRVPAEDYFREVLEGAFNRSVVLEEYYVVMTCIDIEKQCFTEL